MDVKKVGVLGCGLMGSGIAQVAATAGFDVTVLEVEQKFLEQGFAAIEKSLAKFAEKGTIKETPQAIRGRLKGTTKKEDLAGCDIVMEAIIENVEEKKKMYSSIEGIDNAMKLGCGYPMGPFTLLDFVGLDTTYYITHVMYDEFKERRFASPPLLKRLVMAGWYGRKTGKGFYDYSDPNIPKANKL